MALKILVGGYSSMITALLYSAGTGGSEGSLSVLSSTYAGNSPSWIALSPVNSSILYSNQETSNGEIIAYTIDPTTAALTQKSTVSTGGSDPAHFAVLFSGGAEIIAANVSKIINSLEPNFDTYVSKYDGASVSTIVLGSDLTKLPSSAGPLITFTGSGPNQSRQTVPHPHEVSIHRQ